MNFQNDSILFKDIKLSPMNDLKVKQQIQECIIAIISDQILIINEKKVGPGSNIFLVPLQMISCSISNQHLERVNLTQQWTNTWRGSIWHSNNSRGKKWLKQHRRNRRFIAEYLEDKSLMQNAWYQQDICFKCSKYPQSFKWSDSAVEFRYF